jgi:hypothetical protein
MTAITGYGAWFWVRGIDTMATCDERVACGGLDICFFAPMKVKSHATRALNLVIAVGAALYYGAMSITALVAGVCYVARKLRGRRDDWELIEQPDSDCALDKRE